MNHALIVGGIQLVLVGGAYRLGGRHMRRRLQTTDGRQRYGHRQHGGQYVMGPQQPRPQTQTRIPDPPPTGTTPTLLAVMVRPPARRVPTTEMEAAR